MVAAGCTSQASSQPQQSVEETDAPDPGETAASGQTAVYYTSSGFRPASITVEKGTTVEFINNASSPMWVGSDEHPRHTNYNGDAVNAHCSGGEPVDSDVFDQCSSGERFSFTFNKTGTWGYHNHRNAAHSGKITVQ